MKWITLKAAEWLPDQADFENPGATTAEGCYAGARGYLPIPALKAYSDVIATTADDWVRGAAAIKDADNNTHVYAGDAGKLYELSATAWEDISVAGAYSGTATDERWYFAAYGQSQFIGTNYNNAPQLIVPGSNAVALPGTPPRARYVATIRDWLVLAYTNDGTAHPTRVQWSGYNNSQHWTRSIALQSDYQDLYEGGHITGLQEAGGQGVVLQENAVHIMTPTGPPTTWAFSRAANALGTKTPGSVVSHRDRVWWIGESDIWEYAGGQIRPIAAERVARTFFDEYDAAYQERVSAAVDPQRNLVMWAYPGADHVDGQPNRLLCYAWNVNRWTLIRAEASVLFQFLSPGYTLDGLDGINTSIDDLPASLDSDEWKGGQLNFAAFTPDKKMSTFTGTPYTATIETSELRAQPGRHVEVTNTRPLHEGGDATVSLGTRALHTDAVAWKQAAPCNASGECNIRSNARFTRARVQLSGNWSHAIGVDLYARDGGTR